MASPFNPTPIPEPANPPPLPQPLPEPPPNLAVPGNASNAWLDSAIEFNLLRVARHAFWLLAAHGISPSGSFPFVCVACHRPWPCPEVVWAADWTLAAEQRDFLAAVRLQVSDDTFAIIERWHRDGVALAEARAA